MCTEKGTTGLYQGMKMCEGVCVRVCIRVGVSPKIVTPLSSLISTMTVQSVVAMALVAVVGVIGGPEWQRTSRDCPLVNQVRQLHHLGVIGAQLDLWTHDGMSLPRRRPLSCGGLPYPMSYLRMQSGECVAVTDHGSLRC